MEIKQQELRAPDQTGVDGRKAWKCQMKPDGSARLAIWFLQAPGAHAFWDMWLVSVVHLRPIPGVEDARKQYPGAEYELSVAAMDPSKPYNIDGAAKTESGATDWNILTPLEIVKQFHFARSGADDAAITVAEQYVSNVLAHRGVSPDSDFRRFWEGWLEDVVNGLNSAN